MRVVVITPPSPVVTLEEAKRHLKREDVNDDDALITGLVAAATAHIDGPDGWLGRALGAQTLEARLDRFDEAVLPFPPLLSITSVKYLTDAGELTITPSLYETIGSQLVPVNGAAWPSPLYRAEAVRVRYQAGYATLPAPIRAAILLMVDDLYRNRGETVVGGPVARVGMAPSVAALLAPYRVYR